MGTGPAPRGGVSRECGWSGKKHSCKLLVQDSERDWRDSNRGQEDSANHLPESQPGMVSRSAGTASAAGVPRNGRA